MLILLGILLLLAAVACTEDKGNYDYVPLNELTLEGMAESYQVEKDSAFAISMTITGETGFSEANYDFLWYAWNTLDEKSIPDTLSYEKNLDMVMSLPVGEYTLRYVVTDKETGVYYAAEADLSVINSFSKGVVALSRIEGGESDLTFINSVNTVTKHAYKEANAGISAGMEPLGVYYLGGGYGTKNVLLIATEEKQMTVEPVDFTDYRSLAGWFYLEPEGTVEAFGTDGLDEYLIIDGKAYSRTVYPSANPTGMYSYKIAGEYDLAPFVLEGSSIFFYDKEKHCFYFYPGWSGMIVATSEGSAFNAADTGMDMLYGQTFEEDMRAVMVDDMGKRYMISGLQTAEYDLDLAGYQPIINAQRKLEMTQEGANEAISFTISSKDPDFLYYAYENQIVCVSMLNGMELSRITLDQTIDRIEFNEADNPELLYVAVSDGSETTDSGSIYFFEMASNGTLTEKAYFENVCGKVIDFEYKP
jgi:hypothetical protein